MADPSPDTDAQTGPQSGPQTGTRIAVLSSASGGGGGIAAQRLATALSRQPGVTADFLTRDQLGDLPAEVAPMRSMSNRRQTDTHFTVEYPGYRRDWLVDLLAGYDIVNVHWASYLLSLAELDALARRGVAMLFLLHDFHYITGGCHYPADCENLSLGCHDCPQADTTLCDPRFIPVNLRLKRALFARANVHLAAPSHHLRDRAVASGIVPAARAHVLRNPYQPLTPKAARPRDGVTRILLIADSLTERRKAMPLALDSLAALHRRLRGSPHRVHVDVVGAADDPALRDRLAGCGLAHRLHGRITDHARLVDIFAASDIVLSCSYEDNWPNILVEAGAYGCVPVVGPGHGCEEFVTTYGTGAVAPAYTPGAFADTLRRMIATRQHRDRPDTGVQARIRADHQDGQIAARFLRIAATIARPTDPDRGPDMAPAPEQSLNRDAQPAARQPQPA
ncbi:glycosyltransferase [Sedimentitalea sp. HM32M-2]|uniref:glycosyltransferase n=1 Tax=Sedimentitalea sp. HM32M-2 TaxID=3351566 RepID=UPI0036412D95